MRTLRYTRKYRECVYRCQRPHVRFTALRDDRCLFILHVFAFDFVVYVAIYVRKRNLILHHLLLVFPL